MSDQLRILVTTFPDRRHAEEVTRLLVDAGLAACGQVGADLLSFYRWEGRVQSENEVAVAYKVRPDRFDLFVGELKQRHPYDVPQLMAWQTDWVDADYLAWTRGEGDPTR